MSKCCYLPVDAPLWLDLGDGGILHILEAQVFLEMSLVNAHRHGNVAVAVQWCVGPAGEPLTTSPNITTEQWKIRTFIILITVSSYGFYSSIFYVRNHPISCLSLLLTD